jgi:hypothetical protein
MRGIVPGASFRFATSPSRVSDRSAIHGAWDDTDTSVILITPLQQTFGADQDIPEVPRGVMPTYAGGATSVGRSRWPGSRHAGQNAETPVRARPISSFWISLVPS